MKAALIVGARRGIEMEAARQIVRHGFRFLLMAERLFPSAIQRKVPQDEGKIGW